MGDGRQQGIAGGLALGLVMGAAGGLLGRLALQGQAHLVAQGLGMGAQLGVGMQGVRQDQQGRAMAGQAAAQGQVPGPQLLVAPGTGAEGHALAPAGPEAGQLVRVRIADQQLALGQAVLTRQGSGAQQQGRGRGQQGVELPLQQRSGLDGGLAVPQRLAQGAQLVGLLGMAARGVRLAPQPAQQHGHQPGQRQHGRQQP